MAAVSTPSEFLPPAPSATMSYPAGGAVIVVEALGDGCRRLAVDLHRVSKIEPQALGSLWGALRGIRRRGCTLAGAGARPAVVPSLEALGSGGLTLQGTVRAALSNPHDPGHRS